MSLAGNPLDVESKRGRAEDGRSKRYIGRVATET
jgi:hypothetical protein